MLVGIEAKELYHRHNAYTNEFVFKPAVHKRYYIGGDAKNESIDAHEVAEELLHLWGFKLFIEEPILATLHAREDNLQAQIERGHCHEEW